MSCIMLDRAHFVMLGCALETRLPRTEQTLAECIGGENFHPEDGNDERTLAERIIARWYRANVEAYGARYDGRHGSPDAFDSAIYREMRPRMELETLKGRVRVVKALESLKYQCSEDVPGEGHERVLESIGRAIEIQSRAIISGLPEYESAQWCVGEWK